MWHVPRTFLYKGTWRAGHVMNGISPAVRVTGLPLGTAPLSPVGECVGACVRPILASLPPGDLQRT